VVSGGRLGESVSGLLLNFPEAKSRFQQAHLRFHLSRLELVFLGATLHLGEPVLPLAACLGFHLVPRNSPINLRTYSLKSTMTHWALV